MILKYDNHRLTYPGLAGCAQYDNGPSSGLYYSSDDVISARVSNLVVSQPINVATTAYNYQVITFQEAGTTRGARDWFINPHNWRARQHTLVGNFKGIRAAGTFTATNPDVYEVTRDNEPLRYYSNIPETAWAYFKFVVDRSANQASAFWDDTYMGYGTVASVTGVDNVAVKSEQSMNNISARYFRVAGFDNLGDAVAWTDYKVG